MIRNLLLSHSKMTKKYQTLHRKEFEYPYFYQITKHNHHFYFLGAHHTFDPENPQINKIKNYWQEFLDDTKSNISIALIEGGNRPLIDDENEAIRKQGESGLTNFLAAKANIPVISPEPEPKQEIKELLRHFGKADIEYYYFARTVLQWNKLSPKPDFTSYIERSLKRDQIESGWTDFEFTLDNLIQIHNHKYPHTFDTENCLKCVYHDSDPATSQVSSLSSIIRDEKLVTAIKNLWDQGKNVFTVYGSGHAIVCEPALKKLLT